MARTEIPVTVLGADGRPLAGASVTVKTRPGGATATVYQAETGAATSANPLTSDAQGRVSGWLERGAYDAVITASGLTPWTEPIDAAPAGAGTIDDLWLPDGIVTARTIADNAVTAAKIAADAVGSSEIAADAVGAPEIAAGAVGTAELADAAATFAKLAAGAAFRLISLWSLPAFNLGANGAATLLAAQTFAAVGGRNVWALFLEHTHNPSAGTASVAFRVNLDGAPFYAPGFNVASNGGALCAALLNMGALAAGNHTVSVTTDQGNTPAAHRNDGNGLLAVFDQ